MASAEFNWLVPLDHPAFAGHFPGNPIVPGVVLLDQAFLLAEKMLDVSLLSWQLGNAKFLSPALPGEVLTYALIQKPSGAIVFVVESAGRVVATGSLTPGLAA